MLIDCLCYTWILTEWGGGDPDPHFVQGSTVIRFFKNINLVINHKLLYLSLSYIFNCMSVLIRKKAFSNCTNIFAKRHI